jgi:hypothetical protein
MDEEKLIDQSQLAESVAEKIQYDFRDKFLVKPLDPIMVKKEFSKPVPTGESTKDENGIEAVDYDKVETEVKEVESDFKKGVVLKVPFTYSERMKDEKFREMPIKVGDIIVYSYGKWFDIMKDTELVGMYDVIAVIANAD